MQDLNQTPELKGGEDNYSNPTPEHCKVYNNKQGGVKLSIQDQIKKQSMVYVNRMSVLDQHRFVINPQSFKSNVTKSVHSFKQSFKSSDLIDEHLLKKEDEGSYKNFLKND